MKLGRRQILSLAALPALALRSGAQRRKPVFRTNPFTLGVASGDPGSDGFVLWTRLATEPLSGGGIEEDEIDVRWEVSEDDAFSRIVRSGTAVADPRLAHSVHVEVDGLRPDRWYWYRFFAGDDGSGVGRARTTPAPGAVSPHLSFAFASCQHFETGYYTAYRHMAAEAPDLVFHLGDYIYEGRSNPRVRAHLGGRSGASAITATATRCTAPMRIFRLPTPAALGSLRGTTTRSTTTTQRTSPNSRM